MIALIDIGIGNINSVAKALKRLRIDYKIVSNPIGMVNYSKIIFPGVGSFSEASQKLEQSGLKKMIRDAVVQDKKPFLGICLGMQLIAKSSEEGGESLGLELIDAEVIRIPRNDKIKIPHVGWNNVEHDGRGLFRGIVENTDFYFVHSYRMVLQDDSATRFYTDYGQKIVAFIEKDNIYGAQFHPEKSQIEGLKLIRNFSDLC